MYHVEEAKKVIRDKLNNAVKKRVENTERPIGCLLSGGLDSSIIASLVQKNTDKKLRTFSIGLEGSVDIKYSRIMAKYLNSDHHEFIVTEEEARESEKTHSKSVKPVKIVLIFFILFTLFFFS